MPALDINLINQLGHDLHTTSPGYMGEDEVCPWTLFLTMALTLLKGVMPYVPKVLPAIIPDPETRRRAEETFLSEEFKENIEAYFVDNIKNEIQAPLNRQIIKSSETIMSVVNMIETLINAFMPNFSTSDADGLNDRGTTDNRPRAYGDGFGYGGTISQLVNFAKTLYSLTKK